VKTVKENLEAELVEANDDFVILAWGERAQKIGKETVQKNTNYLMEISKSSYSNI
jgi:ribosome maturation factor RimP